MVSDIPPDSVDTLNDLMLNPKYSHMNVVTVSGLWQEAALKQSAEGTIQCKLSERILEHVPGTLGFNVMEKVLQYISPFIANNLTVVVDRDFIPVIIVSYSSMS